MEKLMSGSYLFVWQILGFLLIAGLLYAGIKLYIMIYKYFKNKQ